ncbi:MAG: hypothetical protein V4695_00340 [Pseudomonadota bacterium]
MPTVRKSPNEVQVDDIVYIFDNVLHADAFEACVATVDVSHCVTDHPPSSQVPADKPLPPLP